MKKIVFGSLILVFFLCFSSGNRECSLQSLGLKSYSELYDNLKQPPQSDEDLGRYIGYGWKSFTGFVYKIFSIFGSGCHSFYKDAVVLCDNFNDVKNSKDKQQLLNRLKKLMIKLSDKSEGYGLIKKFYEDIVSYTGKDQNVSYLLKRFSNDILDIENYYRYRNIFIDRKNKKVYIPYTWLVPLNVVYNRSLQNLSSYYTDIGYIWLIVWIIVLLSFIYSIFTTNKILFSISIASVFGYMVWWFVGSAILWYGIGIIVWSILVNITFFYFLIKNLGRCRVVGYILIFLYVTLFLGQLFLNYIRISSQGGEGPFIWYKENCGYKQVLSDYLEFKKEVMLPYKYKDVLNLQFPHYNKFLSIANLTGRDYNIFLAGTYSRYFINNQKGIVYDQMLGILWKRMSDWDVCRTYLRIYKDKKIKYIVIDPNIGTVVMGGGNKTLFDRFYGNINLDTRTLQGWGVLSFLGKLYESGYLSFFYSNNIAAKYGFVLSDNDLKRYLKLVNPNLTGVNKNDIAILRGAMVAMRYPWILRLMFRKFISDDDKFVEQSKKVDVYLYNFWVNFIGNIFIDRIKSGKVVEDLADIYGRQIDEDKVLTLYLAYQKGLKRQVVEGIKYLNYNERFILAEAISLFEILKSGNKVNIQKTIGNILFSSIMSPSQIFVVKFR